MEEANLAVWQQPGCSAYDKDLDGSVRPAPTDAHAQAQAQAALQALVERKMSQLRPPSALQADARLQGPALTSAAQQTQVCLLPVLSTCTVRG